VKYLKLILIAFLLGACIFSVMGYIQAVKDKYAMQDALEDNKIRLADLEIERQTLLETIEKEKSKYAALAKINLTLKKNLKAGNKKITGLFAEIDAVNSSMDNLKTEGSILKAENSAIRAEGERLKLDLVKTLDKEEPVVEQPQPVIETKKEVKPELKQEIKAVPVKPVEEKKITRKIEERVIEGNRGYLLKDGKSVAFIKVRIEVNPALKNAQ